MASSEKEDIAQNDSPAQSDDSKTNELSAADTLVEQGEGSPLKNGQISDGTFGTNDSAADETPAAVEDQIADAPLVAEGQRPDSPEGAPVAAEVTSETVSLAVSGQSHVQNVGWSDSIGGSNGSTLFGTTGRSLRLEGLKISVAGASVSYRAHVQNVGWDRWVSDGADAGTTGRSLRLEAIRIRLSDEAVADGWTVQYRVHAQNHGWLGWTADGAEAGTGGMSLRLEAVEVRVVRAGTALPSGDGAAFIDTGLSATAHVQNVGWQPWRTGYSVSLGTTGRSLRVEALRIGRPALDATGDIVYSAHVQNVGWQSERRNGELAGTTGRSLRVEAVTVRLTDELAERFDVWYRAHVQNVGWMGWASNGERAGTAGMSLRVECVQVELRPRGQGAPSDYGQATSTAYFTTGEIEYDTKSGTSGWSGWKSNGDTSGTVGESLPLRSFRAKLAGDAPGSISYSAVFSGNGWSDWKSDGEELSGGANNLEAVRLELGGEVSKYFSVWYRVHISNMGWLSWAKDGEPAGSEGMSLPIEAVQVMMLPKGSSAGSTNCAYATSVSGDVDLDIILNTIYRDVSGKDSGALKRAYDYVSSYPYTRQNVWPAGSWETWSKSYAKEFYRKHKGNCYRYSSLMCWLAIGLGYNASIHCGRVPAAAGGLAPHGWVEIRHNGTVYVVDPDLQANRPERNFYWQTYESAPIDYYL